jgi:TctA family transporter
VGVGFALLPRSDGALEVTTSRDIARTIESSAQSSLLVGQVVGIAPGGGADISGEIQVGDLVEKVSRAFPMDFARR